LKNVWKSKFTQVGLVVLTAFLFMRQASDVAAQANVVTPVTNVIQHITQEEDLENIAKQVRDLRAKKTNVVRHLTKEDEEWAANVQRNFVPPKPWPDASHKQATLKYCATVLRSAIDTNEIELACGQLTNQPEAAVALKDFSKVAMSNLDEFATILTGPEITAYVGEGEYCAKSANSQNYYAFTFWTTNKLPSLVRSFDKRLPNTQLIMGGDFYENGKMRVFRMLSLDSKGVFRESGLGFKEDGKLDYHWIAPKEPTP